jgi:hypothetical protein
MRRDVFGNEAVQTLGHGTMGDHGIGAGIRAEAGMLSDVAHI